MKTNQRELFTVEWVETGVIPVFKDMGHFHCENIVKMPIIPYTDYINFINNELQKMQGIDITIENTSGIITTHNSNRVSISMQNKETNVVFKVSKIEKSVYLDFFMSQYQKLQLL